MRRMAHLFSIADTAQHLGVTVEHLDALIDSGVLRLVPASTNNMIHLADLETFKQRRLTAAAPEEPVREELVSDQS